MPPILAKRILHTAPNKHSKINTDKLYCRSIICILKSIGNIITRGLKVKNYKTFGISANATPNLFNLLESQAHTAQLT